MSARRLRDVGFAAAVAGLSMFGRDEPAFAAEVKLQTVGGVEFVLRSAVMTGQDTQSLSVVVTLDATNKGPIPVTMFILGTESTISTDTGAMVGKLQGAGMNVCPTVRGYCDSDRDKYSLTLAPNVTDSILLKGSALATITTDDHKNFADAKSIAVALVLFERHQDGSTDHVPLTIRDAPLNNRFH